MDDLKILITGATGSLGLQVCRDFSKKKYQIIATGRNRAFDDQFKQLGIKFIPGDLVDSQFVESIVKDIDIVIHCAALAAPFGLWEHFYTANVVSTQNIAEACKKYKIKRLIHISTPSIYFNGQPRLNVLESEPLPEPRTYYAKSKIMAEEIIDQLKGTGVETIILRPRAIFGPTDQVLLPRILRLMKKGRFPLFNRGNALIDLTFVDNVVHAIELSLNASEDALYKKYNITNGEPRKVVEICKEIQNGLKLKVTYLNLPLFLILFLARIVESLYLLFKIKKEPILSEYSIGLMSFDHTLSIENAKKYLNYTPKISLSEGLTKTLQSWKK
jgi:nucleoside-diphosphate-sugar epimerase